MNRREQPDWKEVRAMYEAGHSMRECKARFGFSNNAWDEAIIDGKIVPRDGLSKTWKHETRAAVKHLLESGRTQAEAAFELGISKPTVSYHARKLGLPRDERASRRYDWSAIQAAHESGLSVRECCARFGCSRSAWQEAVRTGRITPRSTVIPIEELLSKGRRCSRGHLKGRLLKAGLKEERCEECGLAEWRGRPLRITLHHVNGTATTTAWRTCAFSARTATARHRTSPAATATCA